MNKEKKEGWVKREKGKKTTFSILSLRNLDENQYRRICEK